MLAVSQTVWRPSSETVPCPNMETAQEDSALSESTSTRLDLAMSTSSVHLASRRLVRRSSLPLDHGEHLADLLMSHCFQGGGREKAVFEGTAVTILPVPATGLRHCYQYSLNWLVAPSEVCHLPVFAGTANGPASS